MNDRLQQLAVNARPSLIAARPRLASFATGALVGTFVAVLDPQLISVLVWNALVVALMAFLSPFFVRTSDPIDELHPRARVLIWAAMSFVVTTLIVTMVLKIIEAIIVILAIFIVLAFIAHLLLAGSRRRQ